MPNIKEVRLREALEQLSTNLIDEQSVHIGTFYEFIRDIWSQGFDKPEHFSLWHVQKICHDVEECMETGQHYVAVLPRGHYKSTILGHGFAVWRLLKATKDTEIVYVSFTEKMTRYHISEMKKEIRNNPVLYDLMQDRSQDADGVFKYLVNGIHVEIVPAGLFNFKRGMHVDGGLIADDILRDAENPLNTGELEKAKEFFLKETMLVPNPGAPIIVMGTPMDTNDLLAEIQNDDAFNSCVLPVFNPTPDREVLAPEIRSKEWLENYQNERPRIFSAEFMLNPVATVNAFLNIEEIQAVEFEELKSLDPYVFHDNLDSDLTVAGFDIGKKRHPSHLCVFTSKVDGTAIVEINTTFLDGMDFTRQVHFLNTVADNFDIDKGFFDNTIPMIEEVGELNPIWEPIIFTPKQRRAMATKFEEYVNQGKIKLIVDHRQRSQIVCVDNTLSAAVTPAGHGDAFWSIALAVYAHVDSMRGNTQDIGNLLDMATMGEDNSVGDVLTFKAEPIKLEEGDKRVLVCPDCQHIEGWIFERQKCLICHEEKQEKAQLKASMEWIKATVDYPEEKSKIIKIDQHNIGELNGV
jgi:hypothetical protein